MIGGFALSGFPIITAGFWSKDEILAEAFNGGHWLAFAVLALAALLTAFYTMRQITLTFLGEPRTEAAEHAQETKWTMTLPLVVLAVFAVGFGWVGIPKTFPLLGGLNLSWFQDFVGSMVGEGEAAAGHSLVPLLTSLVVALGGLYLGWLVYRKAPAGDKDPLEAAAPGVHRVLKNKYYFDEAYHFLFVRPAIWLSDVFTALWMDRIVIDGFLHAVGRFALWLGSFFRNVIDLPVWNRGGDALGQGVRQTGRSMQPLQSGRIQQYMLTALVVVLAFAAVFIILRSGLN